MERKCTACGSANVESAILEGAAIRLERASLKKKIFNVGGAISCVACLDCGALTSLRGDPASLAKMVE
ncbi:MAG: hypothetical protein V4850_07950 [Myxococcota bacterium]